MSIKIVVIFIILCWSIHQNNSNYIFFLIDFYFHFAGAKVDTITFFNQLSLFDLYDILQKKFKNITMSSVFEFKNPISNYKSVKTYYYFEFCKNIYRKRVQNIVRFYLITMALWLKQNWRILDSSFK